MAERVRVLLLIPHLGGGGAEQVTNLLARELSGEKYELHLGLVTQEQLNGAAPPPSRVQLHLLGARRVRMGALSVLRLVWRLRPKIVLSNMAHLNFLVLLLRPLFPRRTRVLARQNSTVSAPLALMPRPRLARLLYRLLYPRADRVICQSQAMARDLAAELGLALEKLTVLPNPVDLDGVRAARNEPCLWSGPGPHLLAVGRLAPEKGFDLLLEALARLRIDFPGADLTIAGTGAEETTLKALCHGLGLDGAVDFAGYVDRPYRFYPGATLFVLSSRQEGMPNALLEAAAGGLPMVALPASGGVVDFLSGRAGAWVAPEISAVALAATLRLALDVLEPGERFQYALS